jgi:hypothetical protein
MGYKRSGRSERGEDAAAKTACTAFVAGTPAAGVIYQGRLNKFVPLGVLPIRAVFPMRTHNTADRIAIQCMDGLRMPSFVSLNGKKW